MNPNDFNFVGRRIICELQGGSKVDGNLVGADEYALYLEEDAGAYVQRKIVYRHSISSIICSVPKKKDEGAASGDVYGGGIKVF